MKKSKIIEEEIIIKSTPNDIYEAFMDSKIHSKFTVRSQREIRRKTRFSQL